MNYSMPSPTPGACSDSCPSSRWCHPTISSHPLFSHSPPSLVQLLQRYSQTHSTVYIINTNNKLVCSFLDKYIFPVEKECVSWHINGCSPFHYLNSGVVRPKIKLVFEKIFLGISWQSVARIHVFSAMGLGSIPDQGIKIPQATLCGQNIK